MSRLIMQVLKYFLISIIVFATTLACCALCDQSRQVNLQTSDKTRGATNLDDAREQAIRLHPAGATRPAGTGSLVKSDNEISTESAASTFDDQRAEVSESSHDGTSTFSSRRRVRRAAGSGRKPPRVQLAQRPKSTTTTTSSTTTTTAEPSSSSASADDSAAEYEESDESEPDEASTQATTTTTTSTTVSSKSTPRRKQQLAAAAAAAAAETRVPQAGKSKQQPAGKGRKGVAALGLATPQNATEATGDNTNGTSSTIGKKKKKKPLIHLPFIRPKNESMCTPEAYLEFPEDLIGDKWRARGGVIIHLAVVCYMFYSLALVCERYFMPSLEEFSQRLNLSEDVAGATLMSAGSSAPELFTAILGVFIAKGDVGTGAIVGSAVFNILFVIGICAFVSTTSAQLNWWPVLRDSVFYTFTVLVLILFIYDERVTALESFAMLALYGLYILVMVHNETIKALVTRTLLSHPFTAKLIAGHAGSMSEGPDDVFGSTSSAPGAGGSHQLALSSSKSVEDDSMFLAAMLVIVQHKRLFRSQLRFQSAARYIITKRQHRAQLAAQKASKCSSNEVNYFGPESEPLKGSIQNQKDRMAAYAISGSISKNKFSIVSKDDYEFWNRPPQEGENYYIWLAKIPANYVLHYTTPDCTLYPDKYLYTFFISITWTAFFSYIMVWMVTLIGYTFGIPDSVMGVTFLAAGTSIPDCYSSVHAARNGMADMAVSNSIGSNIFDILIGLSLPWFIQTAIYPGVVATINSRGVIYSVILLFLSLIVTIYLMNKYEWTLRPRLGLALLIAYGLFIVLTCMLEFNLFGHVNPPPCPAPVAL